MLNIFNHPKEPENFQCQEVKVLKIQTTKPLK